MSLPVVILPKAEADLLDTAKWWAKHRSPEQALRWYEGILSAIYSLDAKPSSYPLAREDSKFSHQIRELHFGLSTRATHRVIFTIRRNAVVVFTVRHVAQEDITPDDL